MDYPEDQTDPETGDRREENSGEASRVGKASAHGKDLSPVDAAPFDIAPLFERAEARAAGTEAPRGRFRPLLNFASNAAFVVGVLGFAFAAGTYFFGNAPGKSLKTAAVVAQEGAERADMRHTAQKMAEDISELKANVEALRSSMAQNQSSKDQHAFEKSVDALKTRLDASKTETAAALAELSTKVDHMQHDPAMKQVVERLDRIEKQTAAPAAAPLVKAAVQSKTDVAKSQTPPDSASPPKQHLALITDWVVRDVYDGVALVENARGSLEVALGETIPGAGTVKAIERRGPGWIVITSRGLVDYDHGAMFPMN